MGRGFVRELSLSTGAKKQVIWPRYAHVTKNNCLYTGMTVFWDVKPSIGCGAGGSSRRCASRLCASKAWSSTPRTVCRSSSSEEASTSFSDAVEKPWLPPAPTLDGNKPRARLSALAMAYIGDSIYEMYFRRCVIPRSFVQPSSSRQPDLLAQAVPVSADKSRDVPQAHGQGSAGRITGCHL